MTYVLGDIHGDAEAFDDLLRKIGFSDDDRLFIIGDVIDRGNDGIALLLRIMKAPNVTLLLGNHEWMMLQTLTAKDKYSYMPTWFSNGGSPTYRAFAALPQKEKEELLGYLSQLPVEIDLSVSGTDYRLVHAAPSECAPEGAESITDFCVWARLDPDDEWLPGRTVLFGHTPTCFFGSDVPMSIVRMNGKIALDCGMASGREYGRIGCLRLEDQKEFYSGQTAGREQSE